MNDIYNEFKAYFNAEDKEKALEYIMGKLDSGEIDVVGLYENVLAPLLNNLECDSDDRWVCIWKEHIKTAIARSIVENSYPFVMRKRDELAMPEKGAAAVLCPSDEYHDLGARIVADYFTICGYKAIFVGGNTPYNQFNHVINLVRPEVIAISVSNYYHLVATKKMIDTLRDKADYPLKIVVGGAAFSDNPDEKVKSVGADYFAKSFADIANLAESGVEA